jgi:hypothetical protein
VDDIIAKRESIGLPMLLPSLLLKDRLRSMPTQINECHQKIYAIERETGIQVQWHPSSSGYSLHQGRSLEQHRYDILDFDKITVHLTSLLSNIAYCEFSCEVFAPILDSFDLINRRIVTNLSSQNRTHERLKKVEIEMRAEHGFLKASLQGIDSRAKYLAKRCQAQVQTVRLSALLETDLDA